MDEQRSFTSPANTSGLDTSDQDDTAALDVAIRRQQNAHLPISRLPMEILVHIAYSSLAALDKGTDRRPVAFAGVCTSWYAIAHASPLLWSFVSTSIPSTTLREALKKSQNVPLEIYCASPIKQDDIELLALERTRWTCLTVRYWIPWRPGVGRSEDLLAMASKAVRALLDGEAPLLRAFDLSVHGTDVPESPFRHMTPALQHVRMEGPKGYVELGHFRGLHTLAFVDVCSKTTTSDFVNVLRASPMLVDIFLEHLSLDDGERGPDVEFVDLPPSAQRRGGRAQMGRAIHPELHPGARM